MFNNDNYNLSEPLDIRIERITPRLYFIAGYAWNKQALFLVLCEYLAEHFQADKEFGDNFHDMVWKSIEDIICRTHLSPREAKIFSTELANKMVAIVEEKNASRQVKEMKW